MSKIIKQICFDPDSGRLILSDSDNNHFLCDIYGEKTKSFIPYVSGCITGKRRNQLFPLSSSSTPSMGGKKTNYIEYFPTIRKFEGYSQFPRPIVPPLSNILHYELPNKGKRELIDQLQKYFAVDRIQYILQLKNENKSLNYLTCDLNMYDSVKQDSETLIKLIDNTIDEYKVVYKYKMNILHKNPVVKALTQFKKVLISNGSMKVINGRDLNLPNIDIQEKFYIINKIINRKGLTRSIKESKDECVKNEDGYNFLYRSGNGRYEFSPKKVKFGVFSYENERLEEERRLKEEEERKIKEEEDRKKQEEEEKKAQEEAKKQPLKEENEENPFPEGEEEQKDNEEVKEEVKEDNKEPEEKIEDNISISENISFISADTQAERRAEEEMLRIQREKELAEREVRFLSGFIEEIKKPKENMIIRKYQPPKLKTNGELFFENLNLLKKTNPIANKHQEEKDLYDLKQLRKKRHQNKINANNIGFKK